MFSFLGLQGPRGPLGCIGEDGEAGSKGVPGGRVSCYLRLLGTEFSEEMPKKGSPR